MSSPDTRDHAVRAVSSSHSRSDDAIDDGVAGGRGGGGMRIVIILVDVEGYRTVVAFVVEY